MFFQSNKRPSLTVKKDNSKIILSRKNITDKSLKKCLSKFQDETISDLYVSMDKFTVLSGEILKKFIQRQKLSLKRLKITRNTLENSGANKLASAFNDCNLEELDLTNNRIAAKEPLELFKSLQDNRCIKKLILSYNQLDGKALSEIIGMLKVNSTLEYLSLEGCGLSQHHEKVDELLLAAKENKSLKGIEVMFNDLPYDTLLKFSMFFDERHGRPVISMAAPKISP